MSRAGLPHIEPARPEDLASVRALLAQANLPFDDVDAALLADIQLARGTEGLLGIVGLQHAGDAALLRSLAVAPQARRLGLGAVLVDAAETSAAARGVATVYLLTTSAADWFAARGYVRVERGTVPPGIRATTQFSGLCPASSTCMAKAIAPV